MLHISMYEYVPYHIDSINRDSGLCYSITVTEYSHTSGLSVTITLNLNFNFLTYKNDFIQIRKLLKI